MSYSATHLLLWSASVILLPQNEHADIDQKSFLSPLAVDLIKEKNAEISELTNKLKLLVGAVQSVVALLKEGGSPAKAQHMVGVVSWAALGRHRV